MPHSPPFAASTSPAAVRNRDRIAAILTSRLPVTGLVLEIASGTGEHAIHIAAACPRIVWQPTDVDADARASVDAWRTQAGLANVRAPLALDAANPTTWPVSRADAIVAINMIHIAPWAATQGLMAGSQRLLAPGALLCLYGPYLEADVETAPSNLAFDLSLRQRDPAWGLRDLAVVAALAARHDLDLAERIAMPANNLALIFRRA